MAFGLAEFEFVCDVNLWLDEVFSENVIWYQDSLKYERNVEDSSFIIFTFIFTISRLHRKRECHFSSSGICRGFTVSFVWERYNHNNTLANEKEAILQIKTTAFKYILLLCLLFRKRKQLAFIQNSESFGKRKRKKAQYAEVIKTKEEKKGKESGSRLYLFYYNSPKYLFLCLFSSDWFFFPYRK